MESMAMISKKFWEGRRVLVTGHTGFKGSWMTVWLLSMGADVFGYSLSSKGRSLYTGLNLMKETQRRAWGSFSEKIGDIRDSELLDNTVSKFQPEIVIHLAAQPLVIRSYSNPVETWSTNVMGSLYLMESLREITGKCAVVMVTTDKVYRNNEWIYGYRENDMLGGKDPYSSSKACTEMLIESWRFSFCNNHDMKGNLVISSARAGNVIGGGDWADDRIVPDTIKSLSEGKPVCIRNPSAKRPWQHVLEPLCGYMALAERLYSEGSYYATAYNFGPRAESNRRVEELVDSMLKYWPGKWEKEIYAGSRHRGVHAKYKGI